MAWLVIPVQLLAVGGAVVASARRRPYEAALLVGAVALFCFSLPANYYYVVLALVPAVLLRAAITAPTAEGRLRDWVVLCGFIVFWLTTLLAPKVFGDDIVYDHFICVALLVFLGGWIVAWLPWQGVLARLKARSSSSTKSGGASGEPAAPTSAA